MARVLSRNKYEGYPADFKRGYKPGSKAVFGRCIYTSPDLEMIERLYTREFNYQGKTYKIVFQNRVNPGHLQIIPAAQTTVGADYWLPRWGYAADVHTYGDENMDKVFRHLKRWLRCYSSWGALNYDKLYGITFSVFTRRLRNFEKNNSYHSAIIWDNQFTGDKHFLQNLLKVSQPLCENRKSYDVKFVIVQ